MMTQGGGATVRNNSEQLYMLEEMPFLACMELEDQLLLFPAHLNPTPIQACA